MTQEQRRCFLIQSLLNETSQYQGLEIPQKEEEQKRLLRSLMNVRPPLPVSQEFLEIQDIYLKRELEQSGIVDSDTLFSENKKQRIFLWQGDITKLKVDAIVNAANRALLGCFQPCHSCIDNVIHTFAGVQLRLACHEIMQSQGHEEATGTAKITPGFNLPSKYVLHTVGPIISETLTEQDCQLLASCYCACLELAVQYNIQSIAFCCISTGVFHFPQEKAAQIAVETVERFLAKDQTLKKVIFDVYTDRDYAIYQQLLNTQRSSES